MQEFFNKNIVAAEALKAIGVCVPPVHINELVNGLGRREVEDILKIVPATCVLIEVDNTWDGEEQTLAGLMTGKFIEKLFIKGCSEPVKELPRSTKSVFVRAMNDCEAIQNIVAMENVKTLTMVGGRVDALTWMKLADRSTMMEKLEIIAADFKYIKNVNGLARVREFVTRNATWNGQPMNHADVVANLRK